MQRVVITVTLAMVALFAAGALAISQAAPQRVPRTLTVFERSEHVKLIDNPPKNSGPNALPGFGDALAFNARLTTDNGATLGHLYGSGVFTTSTARAVITGVYVLRDGQLTLTIAATPGYKRATGSIVGGTGAYAGAHGTVTSVALPGGSFRDTITLLP